jgi:hypothetical protein
VTTKADILKAIRLKCLDCSVYQPEEVRNCHLTTCALHPYRMGKDPHPSKVGFAANPLPTRVILDGTGRLASTPGMERE